MILFLKNLTKLFEIVLTVLKVHSQQSQCKEMPMKSAGKSCGEPKRRRKKPKALCTNWLTKR